MEFNERLKHLRKEKHLTQRELASILNYGSSAISNYESGKNQPSISDLKIIAQYFNVSLDYLLCVNDIRNPYIKNDTSDNFIEFRRLYALLTPDKMNELEFFMKWLIERPSKISTASYPSINLEPEPETEEELFPIKVAEKSAVYHVKKIK